MRRRRRGGVRRRMYPLLSSCGVFSGDLAINHAHAGAQALQRNGVLHIESTALRCSTYVQAFDDVALAIVHSAFFVGLESTEVTEIQRTAALCRIKGSILQREKAFGAFEKVGVFAVFGQFVIAFDRCLRRIYIHSFDLSQQLIDGVALQATPLFDGRLDIGIGAHIDP